MKEEEEAGRKIIHDEDEMESILSRASEQNFVPVVDDQNIFIGLVRRREIIEYCISQLFIHGETPLNVKI
ncbi:hypothetical protein [Priestia aryabhattai]